jgi:prepilin-type N-terminal cleavage/methylation domain-containing protein
MKIRTSPANRAINQTGFTLIEMIGVLAVIAILAALLIPKVFSAIADAKINNAVVSSETIKTAIADHYGKYGKFDTFFGTNNLTIPAAGYPGYDTNVLMPETLIERPFTTKLGTNWTIQCRPCVAASQAVTGINSAYSFGSTNANDATGQYVMEAVIQGVAEADAQGISLRLDGPALSTGGGGAADLTGRVKYAAIANGQTDVYIYLTHR